MGYTHMKVIATRPSNLEALDRIKEAGHELVVGRDPGSLSREPFTEGELMELAKDADVLLVGQDLMTRPLMEQATKLKLIIVPFIGTDKIDKESATDVGVMVANSPTPENFLSVAEVTIAQMLNLVKQTKHKESELRAGRWGASVVRGGYLFGKTVGIIGAGYIGSTVMKLLQGFDCTILYHDVLEKPELEEKYGAKRASLDEILSEADIVTVHVPLLDSTRHFIGRRELALMKPSAILINTSRGPTVDQAALLEALKEHKIWGAGLDVFEEEPASGDNPLFALDNIVVSGHVAGPTRESFPRRAEFAFANIRRAINGEEAINIVTAT